MADLIFITARKGKGKHQWQFNGEPLINHPLRHAIAANADQIALVTDCPDMHAQAIALGIRTIARPPEYSTDISPHAEIIQWICENHAHPDDNVVVLLGNCPHLDARDIRTALDLLHADPDLTGVCSVWRAADDHPYRALTLDENNRLASFLGVNAGTNRQGYPAVYFYDNMVWAFRARCGIEKKGPLPWVWLGERVAPLVSEWVTGRDVHSQIDIVVAEALQKHRE